VAAFSSSWVVEMRYAEASDLQAVVNGLTGGWRTGIIRDNPEGVGETEKR
jgi:hypothetical protein